MFVPLHDQNSLKAIKLQYVTLTIIALNVIVFFLSTGTLPENSEEANAAYYAFGFIPAVVNDLATLPAEYALLPDQVSYVSYAFLHANFMHLGGNMLFLWVFGDNVEDAMGHFRFLIFYILCAIAGAYLHGISFPDSEAPLIGASGAAAGVIGAYLVLHPKVKVWVLAFGRIPLRLTAIWVLGAWIAFQIINYLIPAENSVSFASHIGGFFAGAILILIMKRRDVVLWDQNLPSAKSSVPETGNPNLKDMSVEPAKEDTSRKWGRPEN